VSGGVRLEVPSRLDYFASLVAQDEGFPLLEAAIAVGQDRDASLDPQAVMVALDRLGARLARRIPADAVPLQRLRWLNRYFFDELAFGGNVNDYYAADNSYLHCVLDSRRGIPITLALLYIEMAGHAGLKARGISFPGHFLVKLRLPRGEVVIDPFTGQSLSRDDLEERLGPYRRQRGLVGDFEVPLGLFLQEASPREFLARLLRNLKEIHLAAEDWTSLKQVQERLVRLLPDAWSEHRDRGLACAELGLDDQALADLQTYLQHCADAEDAPALRERMGRIGQPPGGRWAS
jgi:regulator of sirC expression with transglutaminase-like and TPR domain